MDILKQHSEKLILLVAALVLLAASVLVFLNVSQFNTSVDALSDPAINKKPPPELSTELLDSAQQMAAEPSQWQSERPLLVSRPYILVDGNLVSVEDDDTIKIHDPVPNKWFRDYGLDLLDIDILERDSDGDGFSNLDEWQGGTEPNNKESRPAYFTKLRLESYQQQNNRFMFAQRTGDTFQIETIDIDQPSQFLRLGATISGTNYEIIKFEEKFEENPATGGQKNVSELTIREKETGRELVLQIDVVANDPDSSAVIRDLWAGQSFNVEQGAQFALEQEPEVTFELVNVDEQGADLKELKSGREVRIPKLSN